MESNLGQGFNSLHPRTTRKHLELNKLGLFCTVAWKNTQLGNLWCLCKRVLAIAYFQIELWLDDFEEVLRKGGFAQDAVRKWGQIYDWISQKVLYIKRADQGEDQAVTGEEVAVAQVSQGRKMLGILWFTQWPLFLLALRQNYDVVLLLSHLIMVSVWPCLMLVLRLSVSRKRTEWPSCEDHASF